MPFSSYIYDWWKLRITFIYLFIVAYLWEATVSVKLCNYIYEMLGMKLIKIDKLTQWLLKAMKQLIECEFTVELEIFVCLF